MVGCDVIFDKIELGIMGGLLAIMGAFFAAHQEPKP